ncbi:RNA polymerase sigma-70 factor (ECF subfamily) [Desulfofundulus luciae]|uniref:RNA polymerase sigma factor n=1 Tax=Desulfofundulus luciae TaxID=74702 RepID=A0ABU0AX64_9FIRM|nr:sigma-70 family RNA polymerase sigma factor [Desulfofundulus luciae]MDQ0285060.1 RNA polymerase sigma-70 factor (ECF subfamily) [Desulfofundulus luciae]
MDAVKHLIQRSQEQDLVAFEQLVQMYQQRVYTLSYQLTGNHADAQDLAQEVFIRAFRSLDGFRFEADFGTWLHRITVNLWLNMKRRRGNVTLISLDEPVHTGDGEVTREVAAAAGDPEEELEEKEFRGLVGRALKELPAEQRAVLILREVEGYSYDEIARMLDLSLGTVKSRLNRARDALKKRVSALACEAGMALPGGKNKHGPAVVLKEGAGAGRTR